jgi:hypothetical protein
MYPAVRAETVSKGIKLAADYAIIIFIRIIV